MAELFSAGGEGHRKAVEQACKDYLLQFVDKKSKDLENGLSIGRSGWRFYRYQTDPQLGS